MLGAELACIHIVHISAFYVDDHLLIMHIVQCSISAFYIDDHLPTISACR